VIALFVPPQLAAATLMAAATHDPCGEPGVLTRLLPSFDKVMQRKFMAGHMRKSYAHDSTQTKTTLVKDAQHAARLLRSGRAEIVYDDPMWFKVLLTNVTYKNQILVPSS
jgi:hypothetical protein